MQEQRAFEIVQKLCEKGCKSYLTGGVVRDLFLGCNPLDYDIVTEATMEQLDIIFKGHKISHVGKSFEVSIIDGIEVAGYRKDTYFGISDKNCNVEPAETLEQDLSRRDLTINSMAFCPYTNEVIDPFNGLQDINDKIIKFTGDPMDRINEDPNRIIRACRFLAKIEGNFNPDTLYALRSNAHLVKMHVAKERIQKEILKAMTYKKPSLFFEALHDIGILEFIFPSLSNCIGHTGGPYHNETVWQHSMIVGDSLSSNNPLLRLAGYLHDVGKPWSYNSENSTFKGHEKVGAYFAEIELNKLKFSKKEINYILEIIKLHMRSTKHLGPKGVRKSLKKFTESIIDWKDWLRLKIADKKGNLKKDNYTITEIKIIVNSFMNELEKNNNKAFSILDLAVNGFDIMKAKNLKSGYEVGRIMNHLLELVLDNPNLNTKEQLLERI